MTNIFDYIRWRGDLSWEQVTPNAVDGLILSVLSYLHLEDLYPDKEQIFTVKEASERFFLLSEEEQKEKIRNIKDLDFLKLAANSRRFGELRVTGCSGKIDEEKQMQFAAMTFLLTEKDVAVVYRGTDMSLVGWKEDFNLGFLNTIPGQKKAVKYLEVMAQRFSGKLWLAGHSKGGNFAVYAAANAGKKTQKRIQAIYNNDGPGFNREVLESEGYQTILARIQTFIPQSSVVGMLFEHEEPYTVVESHQIGLLQHDPYSWEVLGADFVCLAAVTEGSRLADKAIKSWINGLTSEEREEFVETVFEILQSVSNGTVIELAKPQNIYALIHNFHMTDEEKRIMIMKCMTLLAKSGVDALMQMRLEKDEDTIELLDKTQDTR